MLPNIKGDKKATKELHNYIHKCMIEVFKDAQKHLFEACQFSQAADMRLLIEMAQEKIIKE
jgi:hypothetical protein